MVTIFCLYLPCINETTIIKFIKMKVSTLKNKLTKLNVKFEVKHYNELNKGIKFELNGKKYEADYNSNADKVYGYSTVLGYDHANQETYRRFFETFPQVQRHSKI